MVESLIENLDIDRTEVVLDFGCAKGYVVKAFRQLGYRAYGMDKSEYAIANADPEIAAFVTCDGYPRDCPMAVDWVIAKDVLEHIEETECLEILRELRAVTKNLFIAVPLGDGHRYIIPEMEKDVTHKIRQPLWWWSGLVEEAGFKVVSSTFTMPGIKENWTRAHRFGNGFLVCQ
jgi:SAM-dependent methyltransferase